MKKQFYIALMLVMAVCLTGCNQETNKLRLEIENANKECPMDLGILGKITSITYDEESNDVNMEMRMNEQLGSFDALMSNKKMLHKSMMLAFTKENSRSVAKLISDANAGLTITMKGSNSGKSFDITISPDEIHQMANSKKSDYEITKEWMELNIEFENIRAPYSVGEGMEVTKVVDDGTNIVYVCSVDENQFNIEAMRNMQEQLKLALNALFDDVAMQQQLGSFVTVNRGLNYRLVGNLSGDYVEIVFTPTEMSERLAVSKVLHKK